MNFIVPFREGDSRTLLSAGTANELVSALNALLSMRGVNGIKVVPSEAGFVIDGSGSAKAGGSGGVGGGGGAGGFHWRGDYSTATDYAVDDVVIRQSPADINGGTVAGTYLCVLAAPSGSPAPGTVSGATYWALIARGNWSRLVFPSGNAAVTVNSNGTGGLPEILIETVKGSPTGARCYISLADIAGLEARFREFTICEGLVAKKCKLLATTTY